MKITKILLFSLLAALVAVSTLALAYAPTTSLSSGYAVTSNYHGTDVPPGTEVTVTAMTTNDVVTQVTFFWKNPGGFTEWTDIVEVYSNGSTYDGMLIYYANSTHIPDDIGDWGVQALFQDDEGTTKQGEEEVVAIRAASFNTIPEIAVLGTAGATAAMLIGLGIFAKRKQQKRAK